MPTPTDANTSDCIGGKPKMTWPILMAASDTVAMTRMLKSTPR